MSTALPTWTFELKAPDGSTVTVPGWILARLEEVTAAGGKLRLLQPNEAPSDQPIWVASLLAKATLADLERAELHRQHENIIDFRSAVERIRRRQGTNA